MPVKILLISSEASALKNMASIKIFGSLPIIGKLNIKYEKENMDKKLKIFLKNLPSFLIK